jgi:phosphatidylinositol alpha-mannosyltransferase
LKVGLVCPYDYSVPGGVVNHISHLADQLIKMGHEVRVLTTSSRRMQAGYFGEKVIAIGKPLPVPAAGSIARMALSPWLGGRIKRILHKEQFDILHLHEPFAPMVSITALGHSICPTVGTFHAFHSKPRGYWLTKSILKSSLLKRLDRKIAVSQSALAFVSRHLPGEYDVVPNGVDIERYNTSAPFMSEFRDGKLNIVFVGRMEKRKGVYYLLKAYKRVKKEIPNSRLLLVGPGTRLRSKYEKLVEKDKLEDVVFTGFVPSSQLPAYYRSADVFCAPATGGESFGIVLIEAMSCGVPVVASDIDGYNSVLTHNREGLLVPPRSPENLARAIVLLLKDREMCRRMGQEGVRTAAQYSWENIARRVVDVYDIAMGKEKEPGLAAGKAGRA